MNLIESNWATVSENSKKEKTNIYMKTITNKVTQPSITKETIIIESDFQFTLWDN